ncbi:Hypothetical protein, putative [Bodo saltans]|uniref:Uncharacterized protein n=1 Tax=Bodo saltans TaxID=75058 RepID=A0A0S4JRB0_BODSA|nr:Hypothetical protein, putative [Bodo saltans]|eukprot:CUG91918.1 Hypothetical protein, putative [Bodo saltans]
MSSAALRSLRKSNYTFEDFLVRLRRSRPSEIPRIYIENKELFLHREDMLQRSVSALPWQAALTLVSTAHYHQPLSTDTFRSVLGTMLHDSREASVTGRASRTVSWMASMRVMSEAYVAHGNKTPSRVALSAIRLLQPGREWYHALRTLQFAEFNNHLTIPLALDAAGCCSTPATWQIAMNLLGRVHEENPQLLIGAITSMLPENPDAPYALLAESSRRSRAWSQALHIIGNVVGSLPPEIALTNELSLSYISHLCNSGEYMTSERLEEALGRVPWDAALQLLSRSSSVLLPQGVTTMLQPSTPTSLEAGTISPVSSLRSVAVVSHDDVDAHMRRHVSARLLSCVMRRLPLATLDNVLLELRRSEQQSLLQTNDVLAAQLAVMVRESQWERGVQVLQHMVHAYSSRERIGEQAIRDLVDQVIASAPAPVLASVTPLLVNMGLAFDSARLRHIFKSLLAPSSHGQTSLQWVAALGWATQLHSESHVADVASKVNASSQRVISTLDPQIASILVHLCVAGGSPQGALKVITRVHEHSRVRFAHANEIKALLFCMLYGRESEARVIVETAAKKSDAAARPLAALWKRWDWNAFS